MGAAGLGFRVLGSGVWGLGFRGLGLGAERILSGDGGGGGLYEGSIVICRECIRRSKGHWVNWKHMWDCQNYGPFLDPYYSTAPNI